MQRGWAWLREGLQLWRRNPALIGIVPLQLNGVELDTLSVAIDGGLLSPSDYTLGEETLLIERPPAQFRLETQVRIQPDKNTQLSGFYRSRDNSFSSRIGM